MRRAAAVIAASLALSVPAASAQAADPAICAVEQAIACAPFEPCARNLPGAVNLPILMRVDPAARVVVSRLDDGTERRSEIASVADTATAVTMQGVDEGRPWLMQISRQTGRFSLATAHPEEAFAAFGVCSASLLK